MMKTSPYQAALKVSEYVARQVSLQFRKMRGGEGVSSGKLVLTWATISQTPVSEIRPGCPTSVGSLTVCIQSVCLEFVQYGLWVPCRARNISITCEHDTQHNITQHNMQVGVSMLEVGGHGMQLEWLWDECVISGYS